MKYKKQSTELARFYFDIEFCLFVFIYQMFTYIFLPFFEFALYNKAQLRKIFITHTQILIQQRDLSIDKALDFYCTQHNHNLQDGKRFSGFIFQHNKSLANKHLATIYLNGIISLRVYKYIASVRKFINIQRLIMRYLL